MVSRPEQHVSDAASSRGVRPHGKGPPEAIGSPKKRKKAVTADRHYSFDSSGSNTTNRRGLAVCPDFQEGRCNSLPCPKNLAHQCRQCLDPGHGASQCPRKGKGGGKGSKGRGKGKRNQW